MDHGPFVRIALLTSAFAFVVALVSPAAQANWSGANGFTGCGGGSPVNKADGGTHWFHYIGLDPAVQSSVNYARVYNLNTTDAVTAYDSTLDSSTDVIVRNQDYGGYCGYDWHGPGHPGMIGLATCDSLVILSCEQHTVRFALSYYAGEYRG